MNADWCSLRLINDLRYQVPKFIHASWIIIIYDEFETNRRVTIIKECSRKSAIAETIGMTEFLEN